MTFEEIEKNETIRAYISKADESLVALGYTEHSFAHVTHRGGDGGLSARDARLSGARTVELAKIAGYLHDIGNLVNRIDHSPVRRRHGVPDSSTISLGFAAGGRSASIVSAIGNHDEGTGVPVNVRSRPPSSSRIKADVRRSRVRNQDTSTFDIHDRVNYSVTKAHAEDQRGRARSSS